MDISLRSRLLLSYGLLVAVLVCLFSGGALIGLLRNPLMYESAAQQLRTAQREFTNKAGQLPALTEENSKKMTDQAGRLLGVRAVLIGRDGAQLADSQAGKAQLITPAVRINNLKQRNEIGFLRDSSNRLWLGLVQPLDGQTGLLLAIRRPRLAVLQLFRSDFARPVVISGLVGLGLAIVIALLMARWISAPLKRIGAAADGVAAGKFEPIQPEGPAEVRHLAESFNRMVARVQAAQQSQRDLVADVSHELKTPLTSIQGFTQSILDGVSQTPDEIHQAAEIIYHEANHMSRLIQDLVALARLEAGADSIQRAPVDIAALVRSTIEKFRPQLANAGLDVQADVPDLPWVLGDGDRLGQVLANLMDNAMKYTPAGGMIRVNAQAQAARVSIRVADSGPGIPVSDHERVFERFYRSEQARQGANARKGMGLGLAIARQIMLAHGGTIRVEDNQPHGCVFTIEIPVGEEVKSF